MTKCVQVCVCLRTTENLITLFKVLNSIDSKIRLIINSSVILKEMLTVAQSGVFISFLSILFRVIVLNGTLFNNEYSIQIYFKTTSTHTCVCVYIMYLKYVSCFYNTNVEIIILVFVFMTINSFSVTI